MTAVTIEFGITLGGVLSVLGLVIRISYKAGQTITKLEDHIVASDKAWTKFDTRLTYLEQRKR